MNIPYLISFDIGIKHLSYCVLDQSYNICQWDTINLMVPYQQQQNQTTETQKSQKIQKTSSIQCYFCKRNSIYTYTHSSPFDHSKTQTFYFCSQHATKYVEEHKQTTILLTYKQIVHLQKPSITRKALLDFLEQNNHLVSLTNTTPTPTPTTENQNENIIIPSLQKLTKKVLHSHINHIIQHKSILPIQYIEEQKQVLLQLSQQEQNTQIPTDTLTTSSHQKTKTKKTSPTLAKDMDLITIGFHLKSHLDALFPYLILSTIKVILIENQISPLASRMKTIQGMLTQYFIHRSNENDPLHIQYVSSKHKLDHFKQYLFYLEQQEDITDTNPTPKTKTKTKTSTYTDRKHTSIYLTLQLLQTHPHNPENENENTFHTWIELFKQHKKKDDLADAFLQGLWYLNYQPIQPTHPLNSNSK
jgi:hypothetical protein